MADPEPPGDGRATDRSPRPGPARRPPGTFKVGTIAGADVLVSSSWFIVAALIAVVIAPRVEQVEPGLGALKYVAGLAFAVVLYLSVLLHEASHAVMAQRYGFPISSITLHFLGGMTAIEAETTKPKQEFAIAVVGPLTSLAVGAAAFGLWFVVPDGLLLLAVEGLAVANLLVGVLNLVPGLPLDGGRVLKAAVWGATKDQHRGTIAAGWGGRITAVLVLLWPLALEPLLGVEAELLDFLLAFVVGLFLWTGATAAITSARVRRRLPHLVARDLARRTLAVSEDLPLAEAVRRAQDAQAGSLVTVAADGTPVGLVNEAALLATPEDRRPWVATSTVARTLEPGLRIPAGLAGEELVRAISRTPATEYLLVEGQGEGQDQRQGVYGVLVTADVDRAFREGRH
ncbi:site-2 protease family protein [Nocardioides deserti]|uniref:Zinc metalloprotease n=1 Tax=Nocardioides deserti TaxID=1588644 RepID=A0ABR6U5Y9_9ACTN|nr:site-2 protease family protein [Nocardioides deserti]MBC2959261.1 site-2 protease family protein [Nocardioides deserti]GGO68228.1 peptidase M50 [Nocardioides deserti]